MLDQIRKINNNCTDLEMYVIRLFLGRLLGREGRERGWRGRIGRKGRSL